MAKQCKGKTKEGTPCRAPAGPEGLCFFHAHPEQAQVLGQAGGRKNRSRVFESADADEPVTMETLRKAVGKAIPDLLSNKISPRTASGLAQLTNALRPILQHDLESRISKLEQELVKMKVKALDKDEKPGGHDDGEQSSSTSCSDDKSVLDESEDPEDKQE